MVASEGDLKKCNGDIWYAGDVAEVVNNDKKVYQLVAVATGEQAVRNWSYVYAGADGYLPTNIYGGAFVCSCCCRGMGFSNYGLQNCCVWGFKMVQTNFTDCFACTGCYCCIPNGCWISCLYMQDVEGSYLCVCSAGTLEINAKGKFYGIADCGGCACFNDFCRSYADCYRICAGTCTYICICSGTCGTYTACMIAQGYINGNRLFCNCLVANQTCNSANCCVADSLYELRRVPNTSNCYCFFKDGVFQCCLDSQGCAPEFYASTPGGSLGGGGAKQVYMCALIRMKEYTTCYTAGKKYIKGTVNFGYAPTYVLMSCGRCDQGDNTLKFDLFCCDQVTCLGGPYSFGQAIPVTNGLCAYTFGVYNCCIPNNCNACPICLSGMAVEGVCLNG